MAVSVPKPLLSSPRREGPSRSIARSRGEYHRILVPLVEGLASEQAMAIACRLAAEKRTSVTAVTVVEVPVELPLDAHMFDEEANAKRVLAEAAAIGDRYGVHVTGRVLRARAAGDAIVEEARRAGTEIIVLRAPRKNLGTSRGPVFGRTVDFVLKQASCRVMVAASPAGH